MNDDVGCFLSYICTGYPYKCYACKRNLSNSPYIVRDFFDPNRRW